MIVLDKILVEEEWILLCIISGLLRRIKNARASSRRERNILGLERKVNSEAAMREFVKIENTCVYITSPEGNVGCIASGRPLHQTNPSTAWDVS
jgi:hypothetical protein